MYNMQSGIRRKSYKIGPRPPEAASRLSMTGNERPVNGLETDSLNKLVIASTADGTINVSASPSSCPCVLNTYLLQFFDFHTEVLLQTLVLPSTCSSILLQRDSGLLAVICDDLVVRLVDIETRRIVREFNGFKGNILDMVKAFLFSSVAHSDVVPFIRLDLLTGFPMAHHNFIGFCHSDL